MLHRPSGAWGRGQEDLDGRRASADRWDELEPEATVGALVAWLDAPPRDRAVVEDALDGPVAAVVRAFESEIGLWHR